METRIATTFIKVAELGSITRAAEQLGYSQGAVTSQIKQLEEDLGVLLFDRVGRGIQLTEAGRRFWEYAANLVRASEDADAFALEEKEPEGRLIIEATSSVSIGILSKLLHPFHKRYPKIEVSVRLSEDTDILLDHVRQNRVDFAVFLAPKGHYGGCVLAAEKKEDFKFVTSASDRLAGKKKVPLEDILDGTFVSDFISTENEMQNVYVVETYLRQRGYDIHSAVEFGTIASVVNYIKTNGGHAYLPLFMIEDELKRKELCIIDTEPIDINEYVQVVYSSTRWISPQMKVFAEYMKEVLV